MSVSAKDIAAAAIQSAYDALAEHGLNAEASRLPGLLRQAISAREGTKVVTLITPDGNAGAFKESVAKMIKEKIGSDVEIVERADASLIGGAVIEFGDERIDVSIRGGLERAREVLQSPQLS